MTSYALTEEIKESWKPIIEAEGVREISDPIVRRNTIRLLENQKREAGLTEATVSADGGGATGSAFNPVLISMVRRTFPSLIGNEIFGVQPMTGPTGLVFALRAYYNDPATGPEAFDANEPNSAFAAKAATATNEVLGTVQSVAGGATDPVNDPVVQNAPWPEMSFQISKITVSAQTRALKASYTVELAQDLKAIHGLDAETELANILSAEVGAEINRELIQLVGTQARLFGKSGVKTAGDPATFLVDMSSASTDLDGRWAVERYKALLVYIQQLAQNVALQTRRGLANFIITSANVVGALDMASKIDTSLVAGNLSADGVGVTFAGVLAGRFKVYVDPYMAFDDIYLGYKGPNVYDSGIFFAPYVGLTQFKAVGQDDFQPRIGFKTRYGLAINPFAAQAGNNVNPYYIRTRIVNL